MIVTYAANIGSTPAEHDLNSTSIAGSKGEQQDGSAKEVVIVEKGSSLFLTLAFVFFTLSLTIFILKRKRRNRKKADNGETRNGWFRKEKKYAAVPEHLHTIPESDDDELTFDSKASLRMEVDSADSDAELYVDGVYKI